MEIVRITDGDYKQYEELLIQRDRLEKEAMEFQMEYTREFGELITAVFKEKMECIAIKKAIAFCQTARNRGEKPDLQELQDYLNTHMAGYYAVLQNMIAQNKAANSGTPISEYQVSCIKKIYRRIVKLLHPDISPLTAVHPELMELFQEVIAAYRCSNLKRIQELEILIQKAMDELGEDHFEIIIDNIDTKIEELEKEIHGIITTEPYLYKDLLADAFAVTEKKTSLEKELEEYNIYRAELQRFLDEMTA